MIPITDAAYAVPCKQRYGLKLQAQDVPQHSFTRKPDRIEVLDTRPPTRITKALMVLLEAANRQTAIVSITLVDAGIILTPY